jgi:hypothetical protein
LHTTTFAQSGYAKSVVVGTVRVGNDTLSADRGQQPARRRGAAPPIERYLMQREQIVFVGTSDLSGHFRG